MSNGKPETKPEAGSAKIPVDSIVISESPDFCENCGCDKSLTNDNICPICEPTKENVEFKNRKLGEKIKENLSIVNGEIKLVSGDSAKGYLKSWQNHHKLADGEHVAVITVSTLKWLEEQAVLLQWRVA